MTPKDYAVLIMCIFALGALVTIGASMFVLSGRLSNLEDLDVSFESEELES